MQDVLIQQLKRHEGFRSTVYRCPAGKLTVGYGRNLENRGLTEEEAEMLLLNDIEAVRESLRDFAWFDTCSPARQAVLINMAFNLGTGGLLKFKNMLAALKAGDFERGIVKTNCDKKSLVGVVPTGMGREPPVPPGESTGLNKVRPGQCPEAGQRPAGSKA